MEINLKKIYNTHPLSQIARAKIKLDNKQIKIELAQRLNIPYHFTDRRLKVEFKIIPDILNINHANSILCITQHSMDIGIDNI